VDEILRRAELDEQTAFRELGGLPIADDKVAPIDKMEDGEVHEPDNEDFNDPDIAPSAEQVPVCNL
jgi:hypothetical protein